MKIANLIIAACMAASAPGILFSEKNTGGGQPSLAGKVTDQASWQPLPGATVEVFLNGTTVARTATGASGEFQIDSLAAGSYEVGFAHTGHEGRRFTQVLVEKGKTVSLIVPLTAGAGLDEVVVTTFNVRPRPGELTSESISSMAGAVREALTGSSSAAPPPPAGRAHSTSDMKMAGAAPAAKPAKASGRDRAEVRKSAPLEETVLFSPEPAEAPAESSDPYSPGPDGKITVDGVKYRMEIEFAPETYEEKIMLVRDDEAGDFDKKAMASPAPMAPPEPKAPRAGLLTAGEWNDLNHWGKHWADLLADGETEPFQRQWKCEPRHRFTFFLTNKEGFPLIDAAVKLFDEKGAAVWEARTDNTGKAECWAGFFGEKTPGALTAQAVFNGKTVGLGQPLPFEKGMNRHQLDFECAAPKNVDIVFAVDATGSMGDEIRYLQTELVDVLGRVTAANPGIALRTGSVFYRDVTDDYIVKASGLSGDLSKTVDYIKKQSADGGGDWPEAVHSALEEVVFHQKWSEKAVARICFLVLDASPHDDEAVKISLQKSIAEAARRGIRLVPVTASGIQKETEWLMKFMGLATNGSYVFLTDHSGIGGKHLEPTTDEYKVEQLNDLLVRLIGDCAAVKSCEGKSEIRFQPGDGQQNGQPEKILFYPNPASQQFTVDLPFEVDVLTLYDASGKAARSFKKLPKGAQTVPVGDLPEGVYTLRILKGNQWQSGKVMVVRS